MRWATIEDARGRHAAVVDGDRVGLLSSPDVRALLEHGDGAHHEVESWTQLDNVILAPPIPDPRKIICLGLNYAGHIREMGREIPTHPTLFAKFARALVGPMDPIVLPSVSAEMDWEAELGVVMGRTVRRADDAAARQAIAGYTVVNDVSARDWQWRTTQWLQGKTFERTTPVGPVLVSADELEPEAGLRLRCWLNDELVQDASTAELVFDPVAIVRYVSQIVTLEPGDLILTGTPGGVGAAREPQRFLQPGDVLRTAIDGIGELVNRCEREAS